jgi:hypothetical protein
MLGMVGLGLSACGGGTTNPVGNSGGTSGSTAATAPQITAQPANTSVTAGATANFTVVATGTAPLSYQWSKSGTAIAGATAASYTTPATAQSDSGATFTVVVSNTAGSVTSSAATLTVTASAPAPVAPSIVTQPLSTSVTAGATATFTVVATGTAPLSYQWSKSGTAIAGATAASYTTPATAQSDTGATFTVLVSNTAGSVTSGAATLTVTAAPVAGVDVITYHNDSGRTGQNLSEPLLTPTNVKAASFGLLRLLPVDGKVDAQPLVLSNFTIGGTAHANVVFVATEHDSMYAFDADTGGAPLWHVSLLGSGETPSDVRNCDQVVPEIGITSTPVIDRAAGKIFLVAMSKDGGGNYHQRVHALNLATGAELSGSPVEVAASVPATGAPDTPTGRLIFDPGQYKERSALLLANGVVYTSYSSHCDAPQYTGWILAYGESTLQPVAVFNDEPSGNEGGGQGEASFWNSGSGPSVDASGNIYAMTANGAFDTQLTASGFPSGNDYGNSILKLTPPSGGTLGVLDYFTMYNTVAESAGDVDLGSGGLMLLPDQVDSHGATRHLAVGAGKDLNIYLVDRDNMGKFNPANNGNAYQVLTNALLGNNLQCQPLPGDAGEYNAPVYFNGTVYYNGAGDFIRAYHLSNAQLPLGATSMSPTQFCFPGATLAISANGSTNGILWAVGNSLTQGVLHAYDATNLATELYNSGQSGTRDQFGPGSKYNPPTVANGKVYVGTQANTSTSPGAQNYVAVFGLL